MKKITILFLSIILSALIFSCGDKRDTQAIEQNDTIDLNGPVTDSAEADHTNVIIDTAGK